MLTRRLRRPRWKRPLLLVSAVGVLVGLAACSYFYDVTGRLAAEDGAVGAACSLAVYDGPILERACLAEGTRSEAIPLGGRFECHPSGNLDAVFELQARCPGYAPLDLALPVKSCAGSVFGGCDDIELGTLRLRRAP